MVNRSIASLFRLGAAATLVVLGTTALSQVGGANPAVQFLPITSSTAGVTTSLATWASARRTTTPARIPADLSSPALRHPCRCRCRRGRLG